MSSVVDIDFMDWVIVTLDGWILKPNAPPEIVAKFNAFMQDLSMIKN
jgi:hypothetical protein